MSLAIKRIELNNFRNYQHYILDDIGKLTLLIGANAIGKTNFIEAIQLTTSLDSFRKPKAEYLCKDGSSFASVKTEISDGSRDLEVKLTVKDGKREYFLNGKRKRARTIRSMLPSVLFCPDDLELIKGSQSIKRSEYDHLGAQLSVNYSSVRKDWDKLLRQKNHYLKNYIDQSVLTSINDVMSTVGAQLYYLRSNLIKKLTPYIQDAYKQIAGESEQVEVSYIPSWARHEIQRETYQDVEYVSREKARTILLDCFTNSFHEEQERHVTLFGPHKDSIEFFINGRNAHYFASQGQQRSLVLSAKMAEVSFITDTLNQEPVLLLDDVMSELDSSRRGALLSLIEGSVQTFITSTNRDYFSENFLHSARVITLEGDQNDLR